MVDLTDGQWVTHETLTELAARLPATFIRVHKSYIAGVRHIVLIEGDELHLAGRTIPVGRVYKPNVQKLLNQKRG